MLFTNIRIRVVAWHKGDPDISLTIPNLVRGGPALVDPTFSGRIVEFETTALGVSRALVESVAPVGAIQHIPAFSRLTDGLYSEIHGDCEWVKGCSVYQDFNRGYLRPILKD